MVRKAILLALLAGVGMAIVSWTWAIAITAVLMAAGVWAAVRESRFLGCTLDDRGLWFRSGAFTRKWSVVPTAKVQTMRWTQSPFDRRHNHATLRADTAGAGPAGHTIAMPYFARERAVELCHALYTRVGETKFSWS